VSFNLTARSPELLAALAFGVNNVGFASDGNARRVDPICASNYAGAQHLLTKIDPPAIGPTFAPIPVRLVIGTDGSVEHVHVIRSVGRQRDGIENALGQWRYKPREVDGRAVEVETGLTIEFTLAGAVHYSTGHRSPPNGPG
jgi:hypothetical protein